MGERGEEGGELNASDRERDREREWDRFGNVDVEGVERVAFATLSTKSLSLRGLASRDFGEEALTGRQETDDD